MLHITLAKAIISQLVSPSCIFSMEVRRSECCCLYTVGIERINNSKDDKEVEDGSEQSV